MAKEAVFTMKLEAELRDEFMAAAEGSHRPASQIVREMMRDFVKRYNDAEQYDAFLRGKVAVARSSVTAGQGRSNEDVEDTFAGRRAELLRRASESEA